MDLPSAHGRIHNKKLLPICGNKSLYVSQSTYVYVCFWVFGGGGNLLFWSCYSAMCVNHSWCEYYITNNLGFVLIHFSFNCRNGTLWVIWPWVKPEALTDPGFLKPWGSNVKPSVWEGYFHAKIFEKLHETETNFAQRMGHVYSVTPTKGSISGPSNFPRTIELHLHLSSRCSGVNGLFILSVSISTNTWECVWDSSHSDADARCKWYWCKSMWHFQVSTLAWTLTFNVNTAWVSFTCPVVYNFHSLWNEMDLRNDQLLIALVLTEWIALHACVIVGHFRWNGTIGHLHSIQWIGRKRAQGTRSVNCFHFSTFFGKIGWK